MKQSKEICEHVDIRFQYDYHIYCPNCYSELLKTYSLRQYCLSCNTDVLYITKNELREHKLNELL